MGIWFHVDENKITSETSGFHKLMIVFWNIESQSVGKRPWVKFSANYNVVRSQKCIRQNSNAKFFDVYRTKQKEIVQWR